MVVKLYNLTTLQSYKLKKVKKFLYFEILELFWILLWLQSPRLCAFWDTFLCFSSWTFNTYWSWRSSTSLRRLAGRPPCLLQLLVAKASSSFWGCDFSCFDSMEVKSKFKWRFEFWQKYIYDTLSTVAWGLLDMIDFTINLICLLLGMIYIAKVSHFHFLDIGIIGIRRSIYVLLANRQSSKNFRVGYE